MYYINCSHFKKYIKNKKKLNNLNIVVNQRNNSYIP